MPRERLFSSRPSTLLAVAIRASVALLATLGCGNERTPRPGPNPVAAVAPATSASTLSSTSAPDGPSLPVRWTEAIPVPPGGDLSAAFESTTEVIGRLSRGERSVEVRSCPDGIRLRAEGFEARTPLDGDPWLPRCRPLQLLRKARASSRSHVAGFRLDASALDVLPAVLATALSPEEARRRAEVSARGGSFRDFATRARAEPDPSLPAHEMRVHQGSGSGALLSLFGRGDFDGDGAEDLLVLVTNYATQGTASASTLFRLTRTTPDGMLQVIGRDGGD